MITLSATAHCGPKKKGRRHGALRTLFRVGCLAAILFLAPLLFAAGVIGQTVTLEPPPDSPYWASHAPQARGGPLRSGWSNTSLLADDLAIQWTKDGSDPYLAGAVADVENVYVVDRGGNVTAINLTTGETVWTRKLSEKVTATPALAYGWLYVPTEKKALHALSARTGVVLAKAKLDGAAKVPPLVFEGKVYQGSDAGILQAFDATTLDELWRFDTAIVTYNADGTANTTDTTLRKPLRAAPAAHDGRIYLASWNHRVYALATTGNLAGTPSALVWTHNIGDLVHAAPAIDRHRGSLIVTTGDGRVRAIDLAVGTVEWTVDAGLGFHGSAAVTKSRIVAASDDGRLIAMNHTNGKVAWQRTDPSGYLAGPVLTNDALVTVSANGTVHLRDPATGLLLTGAEGPLQWRLPGSTHTGPAVTRRGVLLVDQGGTVTLLGPTPKLQANLLAGGLNFIGNLSADAPLSITVSVTNDGPDRAAVAATLVVDNTTRASSQFAVLEAGTAHQWNVSVPALGDGAHKFSVTFRPIGASDPTPGDAEKSTDLTFAAAVDPYKDHPRLPDGSIDWDAVYPPEPSVNVSASDGGGFGAGFASAWNGWMVLGAVMATGGGVAGTRFLRKRGG